MLSGSCNCGGVRFDLAEAPTAATACHCVQCRKQSGHFFASAKVRRGFCIRCGAWLFREPLERDWTLVALGALDGTTGVQLERHILVAEKGDYYDIADGLPQNPR